MQRTIHVVWLIVGLLCATNVAQAQSEVTLSPAKDNVLYEDESGSLSNGAGDFIFAGTTNMNRIRRGVLAFDVASAVPSGARIDSVTLSLTFSGPQSAEPETFWLHRLTSNWGEGDSKAAGGEGSGASAEEGDATWIHTFYDSETWDAPGGDFAAEASAEAEVAATGPYTWGSTEAMVADVQEWLDDPESSFGWIILGDETVAPSDKRFGSRTNPNENNRPVLTIHYAMATAVEDEVIPASVRLGDNYPDPFAGSTTIPIQLDFPQHVVLEVYDVLGRSVRTLVDETLGGGPHQVTIPAGGLPSGVYFYCRRGECRRMVVVR